MKKNATHDSETPASGQQVITACAFIHHKFDGIDKVFLPKRAATKKFLPNVFELPGGHIEYGEDIIEGLKREILEEFEMKITVGDPFYVFTYSNKIKQSHSVEVIYFAQFLDPLDNIKIHPDDHSEFKWLSSDSLNEINTAQKNSEDPEIKAISKGFSILSGQRLHIY